MTTHKKKSGDWVDNRSQTTYEDYCSHVNQLQQSREGGESSQEVVDDATKLDAWRIAAGGRSRGRVYGTGDLSANIHLGSNSLTQGTPGISYWSDASRGVTGELAKWAARAEAKAASTEKKLVALQSEFDEMKRQQRQCLEFIEAMQYQSGSASCSQAPLPPHSLYEDDDDSLDDHPFPPPPSRRRRR